MQTPRPQRSFFPEDDDAPEEIGSLPDELVDYADIEILEADAADRDLFEDVRPGATETGHV
jgi:hypothetical protein